MVTLPVVPSLLPGELLASCAGLLACLYDAPADEFMEQTCWLGAGAPSEWPTERSRTCSLSG